MIRLLTLLVSGSLLAASCGSDTSAPAAASTPDPAQVAAYLALADKFEADFAKATATFKATNSGALDFQSSRVLYADLTLAFANFDNAFLDLKWSGPTQADGKTMGNSIFELAKQLQAMSSWDISQFADYETRATAGKDDLKARLDSVRKDVATFSHDIGVDPARPVIPGG